MNRPPIKTIRRVALLAAVAVVLVLVGNYLVRRWRAYQARQEVPAAIPVDVQQQAQEFTFSRSEGDQVLFTIRASRTVERAGKKTVLVDVMAVIHGRRGDRSDEIRTPRCEYDQGGTGEIFCPEKVTMRLGGSTGRDSSGPDQFIHLVTRRMRFDPGTGVAWTQDPVRFEFPEGDGRAVGLRYQPEEPAVVLPADVKVRLDREPGPPVRVEGSELHYHARQQFLQLLPPLSVRLNGRRLTADRVRLYMDDTYHSEKIEAEGNVRVRAQEERRSVTLRAPRALAFYGRKGTIERFQAEGSVLVTRRGKEARETLRAREVEFRFGGPRQELRSVHARGQAGLDVHAGEMVRELRAPAMDLDLAHPDRGQVLTTQGRATLVVREGDAAVRSLRAQRLALTFAGRDWLRALAASGNVRSEVHRPPGEPWTTASEELRTRFDRRGQVAHAEQWGTFRYSSGEMRAEADRSVYHGPSDTYRLTGEPAVQQAGTRTTARALTLFGQTGTLAAEGEVRTAHGGSDGDAAAGFMTGGPVYLASDRLVAEQDRGRARYEGHARIWEGESRLSADAIELFREPGRLLAEGHVKGLFLETLPENGAGNPSAQSGGVVRVTSKRFEYVQADRQGIFEGDVEAWNGFGTLRAPRLEIYLAADKSQGRQRIERARAKGGVSIKQPEREATSEQADYFAKSRRVVLTGDAPTIRDTHGSSVTGTRLTLFLADGSIQIDSGEGERTISRRPWAPNK